MWGTWVGRDTAAGLMGGRPRVFPSDLPLPGTGRLGYGHLVRLGDHRGFYSNNDWKGCAHYSAKDDGYEGAVQWAAGQGDDYEDIVLLIRMTYVDKTLSLNAESAKLSFFSTYRQ